MPSLALTPFDTWKTRRALTFAADHGPLAPRTDCKARTGSHAPHPTMNRFEAPPMHWQQIRAHPALRDLPFKLETDRWGHIVMSPASNRHSRLHSLLVRLLTDALAAGEAIVECSVGTTEGVKVADVAWASADFLVRHGDADPYPEAPELLIEVLSPSNSEAEMQEKRGLYFARGAREVWLCDEDGGLRFFDAAGELADSRLAPGFPTQVRLPF